jgi:polar amino acid transport system permease protein
VQLNYTFQFGVVADHWHELLMGAWLTIRLSALAMVLGLAVGVAGAYAKTSRILPLRWLVSVYVEVIRNTPFLVQLFIIYFSLPGLGIRLESNQAALLAMVINLGAYAVEIVRAGIEAIPRGQSEAARALALTRFQVFRYVVLVPAISTVYPALASQFIILMLASSLVSAISAIELTAVTNSLQSTTFRSFEFYFAATGIYLAMAMGFRFVLAAIYRFKFQWVRASK